MIPTSLSDENRQRIIRVLTKQLTRVDGKEAKGSWRKYIKRKILELQNQQQHGHSKFSK